MTCSCEGLSTIVKCGLCNKWREDNLLEELGGLAADNAKLESQNQDMRTEVSLAQEAFLVVENELTTAINENKKHGSVIRALKRQLANLERELESFLKTHNEIVKNKVEEYQAIAAELAKCKRERNRYYTLSGQKRMDELEVTFGNLEERHTPVKIFTQEF